MRKICNFIAQWIGGLVLLIGLFSLFVPAPMKSISTSVINPCLGVIMFGMGLTLTANDFKMIFKKPKEVCIGCIAQFTIMPAIAWLLVKIFSLPQDLAIGVILVGCCPGGTASNVITYLAKGNLALSVGMTALSTLIAPILTPLLVWIYARTLTQVDTLGMLLSVVYVVIAPIIGGVLCQNFLPKFTKRVINYLPAFSALMITMVVGIIVAHNADKLMTGGMLVILVVILHNLGGLGVGFLIGRLMHLSYSKCVAISIEVGMQNSGLASSLAVMHFAWAPFAAIPGAIFSVWHNISGAILARIYSKHLPEES